MKERKDPRETEAMRRPVELESRPLRNLVTISHVSDCSHIWIPSKTEANSHSGSTSKLLIWLALYPDVADADSIKKIPKFSRRSPWSIVEVGDMMWSDSYLLKFYGSCRCQASSI